MEDDSVLGFSANDNREKAAVFLSLAASTAEPFGILLVFAFFLSGSELVLFALRLPSKLLPWVCLIRKQRLAIASLQ